MNSELDLALLVLSAAFFGVFSGNYSALEILAYGHSEKNGDEDSQKTTYVDRLLDKPVVNYLSIGFGRTLFLAAVIVVSYRFFSDSLNLPALLGFMAAILIVPLLAGKLVALNSPDKFVENTRFVTYPVIYLLRPFFTST